MNNLVTCVKYVFTRQVIGALILNIIFFFFNSVMFKSLITCTVTSPYPEGYTEMSVVMKKAKKEIMLLGYGRSGTSFTSGLISCHPDVFFFYEPLQWLEFQGPHEKFFVTLPSTVEVMCRKIVESFFTCDHFIDKTYLFGSGGFHGSKSTRRFYQCFSKNMTGAEHLSCFYDMFQSCQQHSAVLIKTIRYRVKWTETLLQTRSNFKLLLLYRDPRAILYSQSTVFKNFNWTLELVNISKVYCRRLEEDMKEAGRLRELYPDRVKCLRYEDGAMDPHGYASDIYQFLGLDINQRIFDYVTNLTNAQGNETLNNFSIERNAKLAMSTWRNRTDFGSIQVIDRTCSHLYPDLGYSVVSSEEDLKSTRPLMVDPPAGKLF